VSSQAVLAPASGSSAGALLVSPFNMVWGCYAWAGGVEESKFCLFSVFFPVRCNSSVSPRFYFRKHAFCFLPLAAIMESPFSAFLMVISTGLKILYSFLYRKYTNHVYPLHVFTLPLSCVTSPKLDLFFIIVLVFILGLYSTDKRKHAAFHFLNVANFT
jgi:hypothetical protein